MPPLRFSLVIVLGTTVSGFLSPTAVPSSSFQRVLVRVTDDGAPSYHGTTTTANTTTTTNRRALLGTALRGFGAVSVSSCGCALCRPAPASALAELTAPSKQAAEEFDVYRDKIQDAAFACGMSTGMAEYEEAARPGKEKIFRSSSMFWRSLLRNSCPCYHR